MASLQTQSIRADNVSMGVTTVSQAPSHAVLADRTSLHPRERRVAPQLVALLLIVLVGGVVPVLIARHFGALGVPKDDDWSYTLSAFHFADSGKLNGNNWGAMSLVGQLVLAVPVVRLFGHSIVALQMEVVVMGVVGLLAVFDLAKRVISPNKALFVALIVAVGPMWASLSVSFMTDVPAFSLAMVSLALGARGVGRDGIDSKFFWPSVVVGLVAFTVREYALIAPLAVVVSAMVVERRSRPVLVRMTATLLGVLALAGVFLLWRGSLPGFQSLTPLRPHLSSIRATANVSLQSAVLVGLLVTPAIVLAGPWRLLTRSWNRAPRATVGVAIITTAALVAENATRVSHGFIGPGDSVLPSGSFGTALIAGARSNLLPVGILAALAIVGLLSAVVLSVACVPPVADLWVRIRVRNLSTQRSMVPIILALAMCGYIATIVLSLVTELNYWDRYILPLLPIVCILVLLASADVVTPKICRIGGAAALVLLAAFGTTYAANAASYAGSSWRLASDAAQIAGSSQRVDGGFVWNNYQSGTFVFQAFTFEYSRNEHPCIALRTEEHPSTNSATVLPVSRVWGAFGAGTWIEAQKTGHC